MMGNKKSCTFMQDSKPYFTKLNYAPVDGFRPSRLDLLDIAVEILILVNIINNQTVS